MAKKKGLWRVLGVEGRGEAEGTLKRLAMDSNLALIWSCVSSFAGSLEDFRLGEVGDLLESTRLAFSALPNLDKYSTRISVPRKFIY